MTFIETCRKIVADRQYMRYQQQTIDLQSANVVLTVYDALNQVNKDRIEEVIQRRGAAAFIAWCWSVVA